MKVRIAKYIARCGLCSRRQAEQLIFQGLVSVDNHIIAEPGTLVDEDNEVRVKGVTLQAPSKPRIWIYHKPKGVLVTRHDPKGRSTVFDTLPENLPHLMPIGRLDFNTEGLLLFTNDGGVARKLELPSSGITREYRCRVFGKPKSSLKKQLEKGITIDGINYGRINLDIDHIGDNSWLTIKLNEGKNREIRKVLKHFNLIVNRLIRVKFGEFALDNLKPNEIVEKNIKQELLP